MENKETFKVKIVKGHLGAWYDNHIGEIYLVINYDKDNYKREMFPGQLILKDDCTTIIGDFKQEAVNEVKGKKFDSGKLPLGIVITKQFPNALKAIAEVSQYGHEKYELGSNGWDNFVKVDNFEQRYTNAFFRHFMEDGLDVGGSNKPHLYHAVWNLLALLEVKLRNEKSK